VVTKRHLCRTNVVLRMNTEFYAKMQRYIVNSGIDMSVLRGRPSGTLKEISGFLYAFDLDKIADPASFGTLLDEQTKALVRSCSGASWGHAKKCLDIFLRKATYDHYLRERYRLGSLEPVLELPLDSNVAAGIAFDARKYSLRPPPKWDAIMRLTPEANDDWQATASEIARMRKIDRVHLDLWYWRPTIGR
jgi:hypothetical protein